MTVKCNDFYLVSVKSFLHVQMRKNFLRLKRCTGGQHEFWFQCISTCRYCNVQTLFFTWILVSLPNCLYLAVAWHVGSNVSKMSKPAILNSSAYANTVFLEKISHKLSSNFFSRELMLGKLYDILFVSHLNWIMRYLTAFWSLKSLIYNSTVVNTMLFIMIVFVMQ